jgi:hypothetical protein
MTPLIIETFRWVLVAVIALAAGLVVTAWFRQEQWGKVVITICALVALLAALVAWLGLHP